eukprot:gene8038-10893_t
MSSSTVNQNLLPSYDSSAPKKGSMLWAILTSLFLMWVFFYVGFQLFAPAIVQLGDSYRGIDDTCVKRAPDNGKCFVASIQIIRRLYTCPAQIILGFDVDCCCILTTLDGELYITERGAYSLNKGYNMLNFDRLSPSYEYRLAKYNKKRGFAIWIPLFIHHFKSNVVFDVGFLDYTRGSTIIINDLIRQKKKYVKKLHNFPITHHVNLGISGLRTSDLQLDTTGISHLIFYCGGNDLRAAIDYNVVCIY